MDDEFERYQGRMAYIHSKLAQISERTARMTEFGKAHMGDREFRGWMKAFDDLVAEADELTEKMIARDQGA